MKINDAIQRHMKENGFSTYKLAKEAGISYNGLRSILEERTGVNLVTLEKIASALGVDMWRLVKEATE